MTSGAVDRLTLLDESFLRVEHDGVPIVIGGVGIFEGGPLLRRGKLRLAELRALVDSRLDHLPRMRRKVAWTPFDLARPCWVDDPDFDIAHHVETVRIDPPGDDEALQSLVARLATERLHPDRPPWHLLLVTGLAEGRVAMVQRVHHSLVDGVSGVDISAVLLDLSPEPAPVEPSAWVPEPSPTRSGLAAHGIQEQLEVPVSLLRGALRLAASPADLVRQVVAATEAGVTLLADGLIAPDVGLNHPVSDQRSVTWVRSEIDRLKAIGRKEGGTLNDVVLTAVAGGLRSLLLGRDVPVPDDLALKVMVPVSLRDEGQRGTLGNKVGALFLRLPVGIVDPVERLRAVAAGSARVKARNEAHATDLVLGVANLLPSPLIGPLASLVERQPLVNVIVTNVPGPQVPLYLMGARMLEAFPYVPVGANFSLNVAILSYDGALNLSITADAETCPDADVLARGIEASIAELAEVAGTP